ncbi:MAG: hypothetical protein CL920_26060 [Deltaproteobacteria bacterium]|nr:hypothetical protein [Deltaproteobacteria bacterium]|tara:strand:- start:4411 stop:9318 length:4908 start_codon:yes stop_codon:yes gene_type:complete
MTSKLWASKTLKITSFFLFSTLLFLQGCYVVSPGPSGLPCLHHEDCGAGFHCIQNTCKEGEYVPQQEKIPTQEETNVDKDAAPTDTPSSNDASPDKPVAECIPGTERSCFDGDATQKGVGRCKEGKQLCLADGRWGTCTGAGAPKKEECNGEDDDCNGKVDDVNGNQNSCTCIPGTKEFCFTGTQGCVRQPDGEYQCTSPCTSGVRVCTGAAKWGRCEGEQTPKTEECNGKDDDCDGLIDTNFFKKGSSCTDLSKKGPCQQGTFTACQGGKLVCTGSAPTKEICNNQIDEDCDGINDNSSDCQCKPNETQSCGSDTGECSKGTQTCGADSKWGVCANAILPSQELCNNKDDDCNGMVDDNPTDTGTYCKVTGQSGLCEDSTQTCKKGKLVCEQTNQPQPTDQCYDGKDNDCDGSIDENDCTGTQLLTAQPIDYDVSKNHELMHLQLDASKKILTGHCLLKNNKSVTVPIVTAGEKILYPSVYSTHKGAFFVSWIEQSTTDSDKREIKSKVFNALDCTAQSTAFVWEAGVGPHAQYDVSFSKTGELFLAYRKPDGSPQLSLYDTTFTATKHVDLTTVKVDCSKAFGHALKLAYGNNKGVYICENGLSGVINYFYFDTNGPIAATAGSAQVDKETSGTPRSTIVGINNKNEAAIAWATYNSHMNVTTIDAAGKVKHQGTLRALFGTGAMMFSGPHQTIQIYKNKFVIPVKDQRIDNSVIRTTWHIVKADGVLEKDIFDAFHPSLLRIRDDIPYTFDLVGTKLQRNIMDLQGKYTPCKNNACFCLPTETVSCYSGSHITPTATARCKEGSFVCAGDKASWTTCDKQITPLQEVCGDSLDNDCDGTVDEQCPTQSDKIVPPALEDYAVSGDGSVIVIFKNHLQLSGICYNPDGTSKRDIFPISTFGRDLVAPRVKISYTNKSFLVTWLQPKGPMYQHFATRFKPDCTLDKAILTGQTKSAFSTFDSAIDNSGAFAFAYRDADNKEQVTLHVYDSKANSKATKVFPATSCPTGKPYGVRVSKSRTDGTILFSCQGDSTEPIRYQRFEKDGKSIDSKVVTLGSSRSESSEIQSHTTYIRSQNDFLFVHQYFKTYQLALTIFPGLKGKPSTSVYRGVADDGYNAFTRSNQHITLHPQGDLIIHNNGFKDIPPQWMKINSALQITNHLFGSKDTAGWSIRVSDKDTYFYDVVQKVITKTPNSTIYSNNPACGGSLCECKSGTTRSCYAGLTATAPCTTGTQNCTNGTWSGCFRQTIPKQEICNNSVDDDCDGNVDEGCGNAKEFDTIGATDYDVSTDGSSFIAKLSKHQYGTSLIGYCLNTSQQQTTPKTLVINEMNQYATKPIVKRSPNGMFTVVAWLERRYLGIQKGRYLFRTYGANCKSSGQIVDWSDASTGNSPAHPQHFDVDIDDKGQVYTIRHTNMNGELPIFSIYKQDGTTITGPTPIFSSCKNKNGNVHIDVNAAGNGTITCQDIDTGTIYYRKIQGSSLSGSDVAINGSVGKAIKEPFAYVLGFNNADRHIVMWQESFGNPVQMGVRAQRLPAPPQSAVFGVGTPITQLPFPAAYVQDSFHARIPTNASGEFALFFENPGAQIALWYLFDKDGKNLTKSLNLPSGAHKMSLRFGNGKVYLFEGNTLTVGKHTFQ